MQKTVHSAPHTRPCCVKHVAWACVWRIVDCFLHALEGRRRGHGSKQARGREEREGRRGVTIRRRHVPCGEADNLAPSAHKPADPAIKAKSSACAARCQRKKGKGGEGRKEEGSRFEGGTCPVARLTTSRLQLTSLRTLQTKRNRQKHVANANL